jgi:signal transduction histidine kinase
LSWTKKLVPQSLRSRLIVAFGVLIFVSLFLAGTTTIYLLKTEQEKTARERVGRLAEPVAQAATYLQAEGITDPTEIQQILELRYSARILIIDTDATVVGDSAQTLRGQTISELAQQGIPARPLDELRFKSTRYHSGPDDLLIFSSPQGAFAAVPGMPVAFVPKYQAVLAVQESDVSQAWRDLLPRLFFAGGVALVVGVVSASLLARSITRPLQQITKASEEMARGNYDQNIAGYGSEEVSRLARAFNNMASEVSRSHRTLREFLANVSHELKTPLTSVQGFSQAMIDGALQKPEDYTEAARIINDEAVRMRGLVDDLLYLSQVEAGQVVLQKEDINPTHLLEQTRERFQRRAAQAEVTIAVQPGTRAAFRADPRRIEQALANLVDNAVRHTPRGGRITLRSTALAGEVRLSVHNTGSYIAPEVLPHIFERFFQVDRVKSRANGNTGLGLAITNEIVEAHAGHVEVHSSEAAGTEFIIAMPAAEEASEAWAPARNGHRDGEAIAPHQQRPGAPAQEEPNPAQVEV